MVARGRGGGKTPERVVMLLNEEVEKLGQNATARAIGIPLYSLHRYLKGIGEPTQATLEKLAAYFEVEIDYLRSSGIYEQLQMDLEGAKTFKKNKDKKGKTGKSVNQAIAYAMHDTFTDFLYKNDGKIRTENDMKNEALKAYKEEFPEASDEEVNRISSFIFDRLMSGFVQELSNILHNKKN